MVRLRNPARSLLSCSVLTAVLPPVSANVPVVLDTLTPVKIYQPVRSGYSYSFIDFGIAWFGALSFTLTSTSSQTVQVIISEAASDTDVITNAVGPHCCTTSVAMTVGTKSFSLFGDSTFRAARLRFPSPAVSLDTATVRRTAQHVPFNDNESSFSSPDTVLNRVWTVCKHTVKATSFLGVYIDGNREKTPYEGDTYINMLTHFASDSNPPIALFSQEYLLTHHTWPWEYKIISLLTGWELYMKTGNLSQLQTNYAALKSCIDSLDTIICPTVLCNDSGILDWPANMRDNFVFTKGNVVTSSWCYKGLTTMADIAGVCGDKTDSATYTTHAAAVLKMITDSLYVASQGVYRDGLGTTHVTLHGNLFPLAFGVVPDSLVGNITKYLKTRGMVCSPYGAQFLLDGLFDASQDSFAVKLMDATTGNSWGHEIYQIGSTMTMEAWDPSEKPNLDWNHSWGTAAGNVIPRKLFGIMPLSPGYAKVMIKPQVGMLASGTYVQPTVKGSITESFQSVRGQSIVLQITVPSPVLTEVYVPTYGLSDNNVLVDNVNVVGVRSGNFIAVDSLQPGSHTISRGIATAVRGVPVARPGAAPLLIAVHGNRVSCSLALPAASVRGVVIDCRGKAVGTVEFNATGRGSLLLKPGSYIISVNAGRSGRVNERFVVK